MGRLEIRIDADQKRRWEVAAGGTGRLTRWMKMVLDAAALGEDYPRGPAPPPVQAFKDKRKLCGPKPIPTGKDALCRKCKMFGKAKCAKCIEFTKRYQDEKAECET